MFTAWWQRPGQSAGERHTGTALAATAGLRVLPPVVDAELALAIAGRIRSAARSPESDAGSGAVTTGIGVGVCPVAARTKEPRPDAADRATCLAG